MRWTMQVCTHVCGNVASIAVLSDVLCEVGVTDAALGAGKATHVHPEDQDRWERVVSPRGCRECRRGGCRPARWVVARGGAAGRAGRPAGPGGLMTQLAGR